MSCFQVHFGWIVSNIYWCVRASVYSDIEQKMQMGSFGAKKISGMFYLACAIYLWFKFNFNMQQWRDFTLNPYLEFFLKNWNAFPNVRSWEEAVPLRRSRCLPIWKLSQCSFFYFFLLPVWLLLVFKFDALDVEVFGFLIIALIFSTQLYVQFFSLSSISLAFPYVFSLIVPVYMK